LFKIPGLVLFVRNFKAESVKRGLLCKQPTKSWCMGQTIIELVTDQQELTTQIVRCQVRFEFPGHSLQLLQCAHIHHLILYTPTENRPHPTCIFVARLSAPARLHHLVPDSLQGHRPKRIAGREPEQFNQGFHSGLQAVNLARGLPIPDEMPVSPLTTWATISA